MSNSVQYRMAGHIDSSMFRIVFICMLSTLLRTKHLSGKWAIPVTNNGTVLRGFAVAGQDRLCYDVNRSLDGDVVTKDVTAKRPAYKKKASKCKKRVGWTKIMRRHNEKSKKVFRKIPMVKKELPTKSGFSVYPAQCGKPTVALVESDQIQTMNRDNDNHDHVAVTITAGVITVTQVEDQTANLSKTIPCKTFTQQTREPRHQKTHVPATNLPTHWSCLPSHKTAPPRWMTTAQHIPITLPTCRPYTSVYNPATRWFLKMTTIINRWSRKSKVTKSHLV